MTFNSLASQESHFVFITTCMITKLTISSDSHVAEKGEYGKHHVIPSLVWPWQTGAQIRISVLRQLSLLMEADIYLFIACILLRSYYS